MHIGITTFLKVEDCQKICLVSSTTILYNNIEISNPFNYYILPDISNCKAKLNFSNADLRLINIIS